MKSVSVRAATAAAVLREIGGRTLDLLLPPRCLACGSVVATGGALCPPCWEGVSFVAPPLCTCCGHPFDVDPGEGAVCGACAARAPAFARARAVFRYDAASRALILRFKHGDRTGSAPHFARWLARAGADLLEDADVLVPVPLHRWRLLARRYNQAALLALALARTCGTACVPDALVRVRATPSQGTLGRGKRRANVRGAFALAHPRAVAGRRVLLVDDVLTTGATVSECARVLLAGGARAVDVLTLARVG